MNEGNACHEHKRHTTTIKSWLGGQSQIGFGVQSRSWPIYEMTYLCHKLWVNLAWMNSSQTPCGHPSDSGCQRLGLFALFFNLFFLLLSDTDWPTVRGGRRCWTRPLCVSAPAGTQSGRRGPGWHACRPPPRVAPPLPLSRGRWPPPYGCRGLRCWRSASEREGARDSWLAAANCTWKLRDQVCLSLVFTSRKKKLKWQKKTTWK